MAALLPVGLLHLLGASSTAGGERNGSTSAADTLSITAPAEGATIVVRGVTFAWGPGDASVDVYDLWIVDVVTGQTVFSGSLRGASSRSAVVTLPSGDYRFLVRGCSGTVSDATCGSFASRTFTVALIEPAAAPQVTAPGQGQALTSSTHTLSWTSVPPGHPTLGGEILYEVVLEDVPGGTTALQISTTEQATIFSMHSATQYRLRVRACQQGCGSFSAPRSFSVDLPDVPSAAPQITTSAVVGNELDVAWTSVPGADLYQLQVVQPTRGPGGGALTVASRQVSTTFISRLPVPVGSASVLVAACNGDGCGPFSAPLAIDVSATNPAEPNVATPIPGTIVSGPMVTLAWNRVAGDSPGLAVAYRLFVQDLSLQTPALEVVTSQNYWSAFLKAEGSRYDAIVEFNGVRVGTVSGFNVAGSSANAPTMTTPAHQSSVGAGNVDLAWSEVPGATLYEYFVAVQGAPNPRARGVTPGRSVKVPLQAFGGFTQYSAIARACPAGTTCTPDSDVGWGPWSNAPGGPGITNFTVTP